LWYTDAFDDADLDLDMFCAEIDVDMASYGIQKGSTNQWYLDIRNLHVDFADLDTTKELHVSLYNADPTAKLASTAIAVSGAVAADGAVETDETTAANNATVNDMTLLPALLDNVAVGGAVAMDGVAATDETTPANEATANDMTLLPAIPAVNDAYYFGGTQTFDKVTLNIGTAGVGTWTIVWEYYNGSAWVTLTGATDGTTGFTAAAGNHDVDFTPPTDWAQVAVAALTRFWIRARVSAYTAITTQPKGTQVWLSGRGDITVNDDYYFGSAQTFDGITLKIGTAGVGTWTITWEYYNGSAWAALAGVTDGTVGFTAAAGDHDVVFTRPADWATVAIGGLTQYFIRGRVSAYTTITTQPLGTQAWRLGAGDVSVGIIYEPRT